MACQSDPLSCQRYGCCPAPTCCPTTCTLPCVPQPPTPSPPPFAAFQAAASADQALAAGVTTQLLFQYATSANALVYTPFTSVFQAPTNGAYAFTVNLTWTGAAAGSVLSLYLNVSGLNVLASTSTAFAAATATGASLSGVVTLAAGQVVTVQALSAGAATTKGQVPAPTAISWFGGTRAS